MSSNAATSHIMLNDIWNAACYIAARRSACLLVCRELYGRGLIGSLKATTWYQQLQEKQNQSQHKQRRKPKAKNSIRVQVRLILHLDTPCMKGQLSAAPWKHYTQCFHCEVRDLLCWPLQRGFHCIIR